MQISHIAAEQSDGHLDHPVSMSLPGPSGRAALLLLALVASLASACDRRPPPPRARSMAAVIAEKMPILRPPQQNQSDDRRRFKDAPVYIDGRRVGVLRPLEVPAGLKPRLRAQQGLPPAPRYSIAEYIAAVGGDVAKIREVHLYGGRGRIAIVSGDELRKHREDLFFLFTAGTRGKPRIGWPTTEIEVKHGKIDLVQAAVAYQDKEPPVFDWKKGVLHFADGKPIEGIPYAPAEEFKGTRFYADGVLAGWMKRKTLPNSMLLPGADLTSGLFSLRAYVESLGVDPGKVKAIELVQDDDAVARLDGRALSSEPPLAFRLPRRNQGNILLLLPRSTFPAAPTAAPDPMPIRITAVQLFLTAPPPSRTYTRVEDLIENEEDLDRRRGTGSDADQGGSGN